MTSCSHRKIDLLGGFFGTGVQPDRFTSHGGLDFCLATEQLHPVRRQRSSKPSLLRWAHVEQLRIVGVAFLSTRLPTCNGSMFRLVTFSRQESGNSFSQYRRLTAWHSGHDA